MGRTMIMDHPLIQHKIGIIRRKETGVKEFREMISEIAMLECFEATRELPLEEVPVETPIARTSVRQLSGKKLAIVPILRAGLGMVQGLQTLIPTAKIGHIGLCRDEETLQPVEYFCKLPADIEERIIFVVDPMLATGGSACDAMTMLKKRGCHNLNFLCIIAAPEGLAKLQETHPDVNTIVGALDERLNENGYIIPGLGDAGDRIFGTK